MKLLCKTMGIQRSSFYAWKKHLSQPSGKEKRLLSNVLLFQEYHWKYPSHGYRWLNAKIRLDNEIVSHSLSAKRGDRMTYISGLENLIEWQKRHPEHQMVLHSDQGSVYASKAYNELLPMYGITRSMSRAGTPTDNAAMESINGWIKAELFMDLHVTGEKPVKEEVDDYILFFNEQRPAYSLGYLTPKQYRERHTPIC